jgi:hypothetical protein
MRGDPLWSSGSEANRSSRLTRSALLGGLPQRNVHEADDPRRGDNGSCRPPSMAISPTGLSHIARWLSPTRASISSRIGRQGQCCRLAVGLTSRHEDDAKRPTSVVSHASPSAGCCEIT